MSRLGIKPGPHEGYCDKTLYLYHKNSIECKVALALPIHSSRDYGEKIDEFMNKRDLD